ncbi:MAG: DEAD/DEAH box helicase [Pirellulaceae bacterium]|nr:DEAD/DEAH box helicase [Pirellulaceae bacterium]
MKTLVDQYRQLPVSDRCILQVLALHQQSDLSIGDLTAFMKAVHKFEPNLWPEPPKQARIRESIVRLGKAGLAILHTQSMTRLGCAAEITDFCWQQSVSDGRFERLRDILFRRLMDLENRFYVSQIDYRLLARIAFYQNDATAFFLNCQEARIERSRLINLDLMEAWDPALFHNLPPALQRETLMATLSRSVLLGEATIDAIDQFKTLVLSDAPSAAAWSDLRVQWLAGAGDIQQLEKLATSDSSAQLLAAGCVAFLKGDGDKAHKAFDQHIKAAKKADPLSSPLMDDVTGLMQFLLSLKVDSSMLAKSLKTHYNLVKKHGSDGRLSLLESALEVVNYSLHQQAPVLKKLSYSLSYSGFSPLSEIFMAHLWHWFIPDHPYPKKLESSKLANWYREQNLNWLAALAEDGLVITQISSKSERAKTIGSLHKKLGTFPMADWIKSTEVWRQKLDVLRQLATPRTQKSSNTAEVSTAFDERMAWELVVEQAKGSTKIESLRPIVQTRSGKGWTKGRPIALERLYRSSLATDYPFLTSQDVSVCKCIEGRELPSGYYDYTETKYILNVARALEVLIGHPHLFPANERTETIELVSREPELVIAKCDAGFQLKLCPMPEDEQDYVLCGEGPNRYALVRFTPAQVQLSKVLDGAVTVPAEGQAELVATAQSLSYIAAVQSSIPLSPVGDNLESSLADTPAANRLTADPSLLIHLTPFQEGLRAELFVRPFGAVGPLFSPGVGGTTIFAVIDHERQVIERDLEAEQQRVAEVSSRCPALGGQESIIHAVELPTAAEALELVSDLEPLHEEGLVTLFWPQGKRLRVIGHADSSQLRISVNSDKDWFAATGELIVDKQTSIDLVELANLISASPSSFIPLADGRFLRLSEQLRQRVAELRAYSEISGSKLRFPPIRAAGLEDMDQWCKLKAGKAWKERQAKVREALDTKFAPPSTLNASLRDYQTEGYQWLCRLAHWGAGACLADDMGLGKTLQAIALLLHRAAGGPALVVAPTSLGFNWESELFRFAPTLNVHNFASSDRETLFKSLGPRDVVIASYGLLQNESQRFNSVSWNSIVLDEAQAIKNTATKRSQAAMELQADFRLILTGTPIENHLGELWNLMQFINPGLLGSYDHFQSRFAVPIERDRNRETRQQLKRLVQPFLLRRTKSQVLTELPARTEVTIGVTLSHEEAVLYEAARRRALEELAAAADAKQGQHVRILAELMRLRRACCHPRLLLPESKLPGSKLELFSETIDELLANQHKALVFSQFVDHLAILREELDRKGIAYQYLDGSTPVKERRRSVDAFQDGQGDVFLISLKAGGTGLNLTAADYVLHMDPWWNPAVEDQAADRAHRIGQLRPVTIYRFITLGTIEEKIVELHKHKRDLADSLLEGSDSSGSLTAEELLKLIQP